MHIDNKSIPPISAEALKLRDFLRQAKEGAVVTDSEVEAITKRDHRRSVGMVYSAIKALEKEQIVIYRVRNSGWYRAPLGTREVVDGESILQLRVQRMAKRSVRRLAAVRFAELSNDDKLAHCRVSSMNGIIAHVSTGKSRDKVNAAVIGNGQKIETEKLLEMFK